MQEKIGGIFFDAYGTLFDVASVARKCRELFGDSAVELTALWREKQLQFTWLRSLMDSYTDFEQVTEEALICACRLLNLVPESGKIASLMAAYDRLDAFPEVKAALAGLREYSLSIVSNGTPAMLAAAVESTGLSGIFAHLISVDEIKVYKPSPRVYALALEKTGLPAAGAAFVSSNAFDAAGSKAYGFRAVWVNRGGKPWDGPGDRPDIEVRNLSGLGEIVGV